MSVADVRVAMAAALQTIPKLKATPYITDAVNPPQAMFDYAIEPDLSFGRGGDVYRFTVWVYASRTHEEAGQQLLDLLRDPNSTTGVKYVLENDDTLAAEVDYCRVTSIGRVELSTVGAVEYLMVPFEAEVVI